MIAATKKENEGSHLRVKEGDDGDKLTALLPSSRTPNTLWLYCGVCVQARSGDGEPRQLLARWTGERQGPSVRHAAASRKTSKVNKKDK